MPGYNGAGRRFSFGEGFDGARQGGDTFRVSGYNPNSVIDQIAPSGVGYSEGDRSRLSYDGQPIDDAPNGETAANWNARNNLRVRPRNL